MKHLPVRTVLLAFLVFGLSPLAASAQETSPEAANRALAEAFIAAWNTHDMVSFGKLLTEDVDWVNVDAGRGKGREMVEQGHVRVHVGKFKDSVMTLNKVEVAVLKPDVALVHVAWGLRGDRNDDGTPREPREGLFTWVTVKDGHAWKIRASHNTNRNVVR